jgi:hypothetical protein
MLSNVVVCWPDLVQAEPVRSAFERSPVPPDPRQAASCLPVSRLGERATQHALAADRFAREIIAILGGGFGPHLIAIYDCGG